jgi:hypothetical protein
MLIRPREIIVKSATDTVACRSRLFMVDYIEIFFQLQSNFLSVVQEPLTHCLVLLSRHLLVTLTWLGQVLRCPKYLSTRCDSDDFTHRFHFYPGVKWSKMSQPIVCSEMVCGSGPSP